MTSPRSTNLAVSIKARLLNLARSTHRPYPEVLQYFGMERFLYRLAESQYSNRFVLKGALLFHVWKIQDARATRDIDMLSIAENSPENIENLLSNICDFKTDCSDGIIFDADSLSTEIMQSQREYEGIRVRFRGNLDSTRIPMQIDLGFGDLITPAPVKLTYPTLLDFPAPHLRGYPVETVLAEKLHTMVEKGMLNSRVKDYHDAWVLLRWAQHDEKTLKQALEKTFSQRGIKLDLLQLLKTIDLYGLKEDRQTIWEQYCRKRGDEVTSQNLREICTDLLQMLRFLEEEIIVE